MSNIKINVDNGKYQFVDRGGYKIDVLRHGEPWVQDLDAPKAIYSMMAELDAARVVLQAARALLVVDSESEDICDSPASGNQIDAMRALSDALALHGSLCDDREQPSPWAQP